jgi:hypothetical protein
MISISIYNLKIDTIYMYDIPFDRSFLQLSNGIRHVIPSTATKPELTAKASMAQPVSQPAVYANGLIKFLHAPSSTRRWHVFRYGLNAIVWLFIWIYCYVFIDFVCSKKFEFYCHGWCGFPQYWYWALHTITLKFVYKGQYLTHRERSARIL